MPRHRQPPAWAVSAPETTRTNRILSAVRYELEKRRSYIDVDNNIASISIVVKMKINTVEPRRVLIQMQTESSSL